MGPALLDSTARRLRACAPGGRAALAGAGVLVLCGAPLAGARTGDNLREGVRNGTTSGETEIIADIRTSTGAKGGFAMRMSNLSSTGGGFVNGCRASAAAASKPCYRASNLSDGRAFEFNTNNGPVAGTITAGTGGDAKKPFTTNATGVATGLNADRVDSLDAAQIIAAARTKAGLAAETADNADKLDGKDSTEFVETSSNRAFFVRSSTILDWITGPPQTVLTLNLPAGTFAVAGKVLLNSNAPAAVSVPCQLLVGGDVDGDGSNTQSLSLGTSGDDRQFFTLNGVATLAAPGAAVMRCQPPTISGNFLLRSIQAIQVSSVG